MNYSIVSVSYALSSMLMSKLSLTYTSFLHPCTSPLAAAMVVGKWFDSEQSWFWLLPCRWIWRCALGSHSHLSCKRPVFLCRKVMVYLNYGFVSLFFQNTRTMKLAWGCLHKSGRDSRPVDRHLGYWNNTQEVSAEHLSRCGADTGCLSVQHISQWNFHSSISFFC